MLWARSASASDVRDIVDSVLCHNVADSVAPAAFATQPDSALLADSIAFSRKPWYKQLLENGFRINDPQVNYPRFPRFLLSLYNWGDKTFNSYDPEYVVGVGKNWKITTKSYNWMES